MLELYLSASQRERLRTRVQSLLFVFGLWVGFSLLVTFVAWPLRLVFWLSNVEPTTTFELVLMGRIGWRSFVLVGAVLLSILRLSAETQQYRRKNAAKRRAAEALARKEKETDDDGKSVATAEPETKKAYTAATSTTPKDQGGASGKQQRQKLVGIALPVYLSRNPRAPNEPIGVREIVGDTLDAFVFEGLEMLVSVILTTFARQIDRILEPVIQHLVKELDVVRVEALERAFVDERSTTLGGVLASLLRQYLGRAVDSYAAERNAVVRFLMKVGLKWRLESDLGQLESSDVPGLSRNIGEWLETDVSPSFPKTAAATLAFLGNVRGDSVRQRLASAIVFDPKSTTTSETTTDSPSGPRTIAEVLIVAREELVHVGPRFTIEMLDLDESLFEPLEAYFQHCTEAAARRFNETGVTIPFVDYARGELQPSVELCENFGAEIKRYARRLIVSLLRASRRERASDEEGVPIIALAFRDARSKLTDVSEEKLKEVIDQELVRFVRLFEGKVHEPVTEDLPKVILALSIVLNLFDAICKRAGVKESALINHPTVSFTKSRNKDETVSFALAFVVERLLDKNELRKVQDELLIMQEFGANATIALRTATCVLENVVKLLPDTLTEFTSRLLCEIDSKIEDITPILIALTAYTGRLLSMVSVWDQILQLVMGTLQASLFEITTLKSDVVENVNVGDLFVHQPSRQWLREINKPFIERVFERILAPRARSAVDLLYTAARAKGEKDETGLALLFSGKKKSSAHAGDSSEKPSLSDAARDLILAVATVMERGLGRVQGMIDEAKTSPSEETVSLEQTVITLGKNVVKRLLRIGHPRAAEATKLAAERAVMSGSAIDALDRSVNPTRGSDRPSHTESRVGDDDNVDNDDNDENDDEETVSGEPSTPTGFGAGLRRRRRGPRAMHARGLIGSQRASSDDDDDTSIAAASTTKLGDDARDESTTEQVVRVSGGVNALDADDFEKIIRKAWLSMRGGASESVATPFREFGEDIYQAVKEEAFVDLKELIEEFSTHLLLADFKTVVSDENEKKSRITGANSPIVLAFLLRAAERIGQLAFELKCAGAVLRALLNIKPVAWKITGKLFFKENSQALEIGGDLEKAMNTFLEFTDTVAATVESWSGVTCKFLMRMVRPDRVDQLMSEAASQFVVVLDRILVNPNAPPTSFPPQFLVPVLADLGYDVEDVDVKRAPKFIARRPTRAAPQRMVLGDARRADTMSRKLAEHDEDSDDDESDASNRVVVASAVAPKKRRRATTLGKLDAADGESLEEEEARREPPASWIAARDSLSNMFMREFMAGLECVLDVTEGLSEALTARGTGIKPEPLKKLGGKICMGLVRRWRPLPEDGRKLFHADSKRVGDLCFATHKRLKDLLEKAYAVQHKTETTSSLSLRATVESIFTTDDLVFLTEYMPALLERRINVSTFHKVYLDTLSRVVYDLRQIKGERRKSLYKLRRRELSYLRATYCLMSYQVVPTFELVSKTCKLKKLFSGDKSLAGAVDDAEPINDAPVIDDTRVNQFKELLSRVLQMNSVEIDSFLSNVSIDYNTALAGIGPDSDVSTAQLVQRIVQGAFAGVALDVGSTITKSIAE